MIHFVSDYEAITGEKPEAVAKHLEADDVENKVIGRHASTEADEADEDSKVEKKPRRAQPVTK